MRPAILLAGIGDRRRRILIEQRHERGRFGLVGVRQLELAGAARLQRAGARHRCA